MTHRRRATPRPPANELVEIARTTTATSIRPGDGSHHHNEVLAHKDSDKMALGAELICGLKTLPKRSGPCPRHNPQGHCIASRKTP